VPAGGRHRAHTGLPGTAGDLSAAGVLPSESLVICQGRGGPAPTAASSLRPATRASRAEPTPHRQASTGCWACGIFEATGASIADLGEEHGHRVLRVCGKGTKIVLVPLPPAVGRATDRATADRARGPILLNRRGTRMDRHAATRRLRHLAQHAGVRITRPPPHAQAHLRHDHARCWR
jgi:hypothetical protein